MEYTDSFKSRMVQKLANGRSANSLAQEIGVSQSSLSRWLREAGTLQSVKRKKQATKREKAEGRRPEEWTAEEKLEAVLEAKRLSEAELGEFLRRRGLHEEQLREWESAAVESLRRGRKTGGKSPEAKRVKELERELRRKEKALAEAAALLVLRKKAEALWGDEDASTEQNNDDESSS